MGIKNDGQRTVLDFVTPHATHGITIVVLGSVHRGAHTLRLTISVVATTNIVVLADVVQSLSINTGVEILTFRGVCEPFLVTTIKQFAHSFQEKLRLVLWRDVAQVIRPARSPSRKPKDNINIRERNADITLIFTMQSSTLCVH